MPCYCFANMTGWYRYRPDLGAHGRGWAWAGLVCVSGLCPLYEPGDHPVRPSPNSYLRVSLLHGRTYFPSRVVAGKQANRVWGSERGDLSQWD